MDIMKFRYEIGGIMKKFIRNFSVLVISIIITGTGASLALKAAVGVGAWDALGQSIATVLEMKVGTFFIILNSSCVLVQIILLKKEFKAIQLLQVFLSVLTGLVINFMFYDVFSHLEVNNYFGRLILLVFSQIVCAIGVSILVTLDFISFPLESCCMVISKKINKNFGSIRQFVDIIAIVIAITITLIFKNTLTVREGTVIAMLIFGPMLNLFIKFFSPVLKKLKLIEEGSNLNEKNFDLEKENL